MKGLSIGLLFSATTVAATVWCLQLALRRNGSAAWAATGGLAAGHGWWALLAGATVWMLSWTPQYIGAARVLSSLVFTYMAVKSLRTPPIIRWPQMAAANLPPLRLATATLAVMLSMPMRFFGHVGLFLAASVVRPRLMPGFVWPLTLGVVAGTVLWFGLVSALAARWREQTPENWWMQAVQRQTRLATMAYALLAIIVLLPALAERV